MGELVVCNLVTRTEQVILSAQDRSPGGAQWTPDGAMIAFAFKPPGSTYWAIHVFSLADNSVAQLADESTPNAGEVVWAPR